MTDDSQKSDGFDHKIFSDLGIRPPSSQHDLASIDSAGTRFEEQWSSEFGFSDLVRFSKQVASEHRSEVLFELVMSDLELRWKHWAAQELQRFETRLAANSFQVAIASWKTYVAELKLEQVADQIRYHELWCRCRYGDLPAHDENGIRDAATIKVFRNQTEVFQSRFVGRVTGGRRLADEPMPFAWSEENKSRLIVAQSDDRSISRHQFVIEFHTNRLVQISNLSRNRAFGVVTVRPDSGQSILDAENVRLFKVPAILNLTDVQIEIAPYSGA